MMDLALRSVKGVVRQGQDWCADIEFPDDPLFSGHFPGEPLIPGILQVAVVLAAWEVAAGGHYRVAALRACKFLARTRPGQRLCLCLRDGEFEGKTRLRAELLDAADKSPISSIDMLVEAIA